MRVTDWTGVPSDVRAALRHCRPEYVERALYFWRAANAAGRARLREWWLGQETEALRALIERRHVERSDGSCTLEWCGHHLGEHEAEWDGDGEGGTVGRCLVAGCGCEGFCTVADEEAAA